MRWSVGGIALLVVLNALAGPAAAAEAGTTFQDSAQVRLLSVDPGGEGPDLDDCVYLDPLGSAQSVSSGAVRMTACQGSSHARGSMVRGSDPDFARSANLHEWTLSWRDADQDAAYDVGEPVFADLDAAPGLATTAGNLVLRLSGSNAGTYVTTGADAGATTVNFAAASVAFVDGACPDGTAASCPDDGLSAGDKVYLLPGVDAGLPAGSAIPGGAVRLWSQGPFGSQVPASPPPATSSSSTSSAPPPQEPAQDPPAQEPAQPNEAGEPATATSGGEGTTDQPAAPADGEPASSGDADLEPARGSDSDPARDAEAAGDDHADGVRGLGDAESRRAPSLTTRLEQAGVPVWTLWAFGAGAVVLAAAVVALVRSAPPAAPSRLPPGPRPGGPRLAVAPRPPGPAPTARPAARPGGPRAPGPQRPK